MKFSENEKLLCYHGPLLYEAKCVKTRKEGSGGYSYYVHYQGWNKNWDEWVTEGRMLKINPESREMQKRLLEQHLAATKESKKSKSSKSSSNKKTPSSRASTPGEIIFCEIQDGKLTTLFLLCYITDTSGTSGASFIKKEEATPVSSKKKRMDDDVANSPRTTSTSSTSSSTGSRLIRFKISIPEELRYVLVNDWDLITVKKNLFSLPAKYSIATLIKDYLENKNVYQGRNYYIVTEVMKGILDTFNRLIGKELLYKVECKQYKELRIGSQESYTDIYGTAHLLRLLSKIDTVLNLTKIEVDSDVSLIESIIGDFLKYLEDNMNKLFTSKNYKDAGDEYIKHSV
ncbi:mortality factor 4-like protein 1 isoform X1 [Lepeophtheirus salmonis]|uniref:mortality factor 4-like protein 1 isoform X1 n=1 Tax=Lepeophtheirus salmonis TaxID=72036 RepID=UPI001AE20910|nr:mortality factor 4-like protein 1 isoform X1 [Lepeophtheirus salmonis]